MQLYSERENYKIYNGVMQDMEQVVAPESVDVIITDPPYELGFMGKKWDSSGVAFQSDSWKHCFNVLKEGGYLLAFGGSRTFHRIATAIEDSGFEIRDTIMWLYGSGFPKSMNIGLAIDKQNGVESIDTGIVSPNARPNSDTSNTLYESGTVGKEFTIKKATNEWEGWGTCLKPAYEPIIVARKPFKNSLIENIENNRIGGLNIDECRVGTNGATKKNTTNCNSNNNVYGKGLNGGRVENIDMGRFPANVILTYDETDKEEVCGGMPFGDNGSAARYFYCAKASKKDRDEGLDNFEEKQKVFNGNSDTASKEMKDVEKRFTTIAKNIHPTVKPTDLMQYLVRLVAPKGATIMDCFMGSGSTGKAVMYENRERDKNYKFIGIEMTNEYLPIAKARIDYVIDLPKENKQMSFDDMGV